MTTTGVAVASVGMVTPLGVTARETIAAMERGERRFHRCGLVGARGERIAGSFVLPVRDELSGRARAEQIALPAVTECVRAASPLSGDTALFLCVPVPWGAFARELSPLIAEVRDDWAGVLDVLAGEAEACGARVPTALRFALPFGHAGGVVALERAASLFEEGRASQVLIVGLDTHGDRATLERLDLLGLLKSHGGTIGFLPGEAAAVLCVRPIQPGVTGPRVAGLGAERETASPSTARGLTAAVARSIATWGGDARSIATVAIDLNGERERAKEWTFAATRTVWRERAAPQVTHPADQLGDVGAATVPLLVGWLAANPRARGPALAVASSRDGLRGGVVIDGIG